MVCEVLLGVGTAGEGSPDVHHLDNHADEHHKTWHQVLDHHWYGVEGDFVGLRGINQR